MRGIDGGDAARLQAALVAYTGEEYQAAGVMPPADVAAYEALAARGIITFETIRCPNGRVVSVAKTNALGRIALSLHLAAQPVRAA